jgi:YesN/AraC family two-component response regulator
MLISREKKSMRETYLAGCLFSLLSEMLDSASTQSSAERALNYINVHYMHKLSIQDLAQMLNINSCYLSRTFKKQYGITMQSYLNKLRMQEAQRLLINSEPVARVASLIGYHDPFLFSKQFKKYAGISPKQFMIKHQK